MEGYNKEGVTRVCRSIDIYIYMGIHKELQIPQYWNSNIHLGLIHTISSYISLCWFEQIKRYCYISDVEDDIRQQRNIGDNWWHKLEPLALSLQSTFVRYYIPSSEVSINKPMVQCFSRSIHTYKMTNKPITQGYKLFGIADYGYDSVYGSFWVLFLHCLLPPATSFLCLYAWPYLLYCLDDRAHRRHTILSLHNTSLHSSRHISIEQKLAMFLLCVNVTGWSRDTALQIHPNFVFTLELPIVPLNSTPQCI